MRRWGTAGLVLLASPSVGRREPALAQNFFEGAVRELQTSGCPA